MLDRFFLNYFDISNYWQYFLLKNILIIFVSFALSLVCFRFFLKTINKYNLCRQPIRDNGIKSHLITKKNTPTMGGLMIILVVLIGSFLLLDLSNDYILIIVFIFMSFAMIGFVDDYIKVKQKNSNGFKGSIKIIIQLAIVALTVTSLQAINKIYLLNQITIPFINLTINIGQFYILLAILVVVGSANAVNLTDGLDGLVSVPVIICLISLIIISYFVGDLSLTEGLDKSYIKGGHEIAFFCSILVGAILGFLKYNIKPAHIFMGDVGSLSIGATIGIIAIILKQELVFFIISLLFVIEAGSVILQVTSYKIRKKRIFLMTPIHHHFEKLGWRENKIVVIFWLVSLIFSLIGLTSFFV
jgi:phospho-N-acetylmuramoyl-pentapeptide-transferase